MKKIYLFIVIFILCLIGCPSEYAPECGQTKSEPSPDTTVSYSFTEPYFSSTAYQLDATTDAPDGVEFTLTVNNHSVTAKSFGGMVTFDLSKCFTEYDKGGIDYDAKVSAENANIKGSSNFKIPYWPVVSCKLYCDDEMIIYNGSAKNFESPSFTVNYDKESYHWTMTYTVLDTDGTTDITPSDAEDWELSNMLAFLQKVENDGKSVVVHICIMPVRGDIDQMVLAYEHDVKYICSKDVKVNSVVARGVLPDNRYDAILFAETGITPDSNILMRDTAGGEIVYAWEISENGTDWTKIDGADKKTYIMNKSDLGKYLRVTIEQTFEGHKQSPIISNVIEPLQNYFSQTALFYDDVVLVGNRPDETKIMAFALDAFEKAIYDITFSFPNEIEDLYYLQYSQDILVQLDKEGFKTGYNLVFVTVQHNLLQTELPTLSTDIQHISVGYAKWLENDDTLEYSLNGGMSYQTVTTEPFETSAGSMIYVRKKSVGTPNKKGYIKESSARSISVTGSHIGRWTGEFSFEHPELFSTAYILEADTNAIDGTEFTVTLKENDKSVTARAYSGKLAFDVSGVFNKTVKGGKQYQMTVEVTDATLSSSAEFSVDYWPVAEAEWNCPTGMTVYNGRAKYLQLPVPEYNYEAESVEAVHTFQVIDKDGSTDITPAAAQTWQLSNMKSYISDPANDGKTVVMNVTMTPVRDGEAQNVLSCFDTIRYYIRKDVKVKEVLLAANFGQYEAIMYAEENVSLEGISYTETAGGDIEYKWEIQTDPNVWKEVGQVSDKTYVVKQSDIGKTLRVTITQTFEGVKQSPLTSNVVTVKNLIKSSSLYYDGVVLVGESVALGNVLGTAVDVFGNEKEVDGMTFQRSLTEEEYKMPMLSSRIVPITLTAVDYEDGYSMVFVPVQAVMTESDLPPLRIDVQNIDVGYAAFELINYDLEYSINGGLTYADMTADTFPAKAGDEIYIRKKTLGTPNEMGYIKESQPLPLIVTEANVGVRTSGGGMIGSIAMSKLTLTKTGYGGMIFIVPHLEVATGLPQVTYNYQWLIDGIDISQYEGISTNNKHELVINKYQLGSDAYHIYCCVTVYANGEQIAGLSSQMTLVIE